MINFRKKEQNIIVLKWEIPKKAKKFSKIIKVEETEPSAQIKQAGPAQCKQNCKKSRHLEPGNQPDISEDPATNKTSK